MPIPNNVYRINMDRPNSNSAKPRLTCSTGFVPVVHKPSESCNLKENPDSRCGPWSKFVYYCAKKERAEKLPLASEAILTR